MDPKKELKKKIGVKTDSTMFTAVGVNGEQMTLSYRMEERRVDDLSLQDYRRMIDNDGQIQMLIVSIMNTILQAGLEIEDDEDYVESMQESGCEECTCSQEKEFIEKVIFSPSWKGGMSVSLELTLRRMLRAFIEGYRVFEVIYKVGEDGMVYLDRLAPRAARNDNELQLITADNGDFVGFHQRVFWKGKQFDVKVENEGELHKVVKSTWGEEYGSVYGRSGLRAAFYHYDKMHKAMYLNHVGLELGAIKFRKLVTKTNDPKWIGDMVQNLAKVGVESVAAIPQDKADLVFESVSDAAVMGVGKEMINYHASMCAKSILAQFVDLGSNVSETGSRSLGDSQKKLFKEGLEAMARILIEDTWNIIISDLIKINFNNGIYPKLKVKPIADETAELLIESFNKLIDKDSVVDSIKAEIQDKISDELRLNVSRDQIQQEMDEKKQMAQQIQNGQAPNLNNQSDNSNNMSGQDNKQTPDNNKPGDNMQEMMNKKPVNNSEHNHTHLGDGYTDPMQAEGLIPQTDNPTSRPLFLNEQKVKFADIKNKLDTSESIAQQILHNKVQNIKETVVNNYIVAARSGRKAVSNINIQLAESDLGTYSDELYTLYLELLEYGKVKAANELNQSVPTTPKQVIQAAKDKVNTIIDDQSTRLRLRLVEVANTALEGDLPENQFKVLLDDEYDKFFESVIAPTVNGSLPTALNKGRQVTFDKYDSQIHAYRYTAVIDLHTTPYCLSMDGRVFQDSDPNFVMVTPPNHFGCRSIWTPITIDEAKADPQNSVVNGKPANLPVFGSLSSYRSSEVPALQ